MAFYYRKLLLEEPDRNYDSSCYMCYVCPKDCYLSPPPPLSQTSPSKNHQMSVILILTLCILGAAFMFLSYLTVGKYRFRRRNSESFGTSNFVDENHGPVLDHPIWYNRTIGLPQPTIDSISMFEYKKGEDLIKKGYCSVCLNEFQENESLRLLPKCSHAFHVNCIDTWLRSHQNCPVCRATILINSVNNVDLSLVGTNSSNSVAMEENQRAEQTDETSTGNQLADILSKSGFKNEKFRVLSDLGDHRVRLDQELESALRRSVSMDFSCASIGFLTKKDEGCSDDKLEIVEKCNLKHDCEMGM